MGEPLEYRTNGMGTGSEPNGRTTGVPRGAGPLPGNSAAEAGPGIYPPRDGRDEHRGDLRSARNHLHESLGHAASRPDATAPQPGTQLLRKKYCINRKNRRTLRVRVSRGSGHASSFHVHRWTGKHRHKALLPVDEVRLAGTVAVLNSGHTH